MTTQTRAIVDKLLTKVSNGLFQGDEAYISEMILPSLQVKQRTGKYGKYGNEHLRIVNTAHVGKSGYLEIDPITRSSDLYSIETHALKSVITEEDFDNVELPFDEREDRTIGLTTMLWLAKEKALADTLMDPAIITQGQTLVGLAQYNNINSATSTPLEDALAARKAIRDSVGLGPNVAIMSDNVFDALSYHAALLDKLGFKEARPGGLGKAEMARALEVDMVLVGEAVFNNAKKGQADSIEKVWQSDLIYAKIGIGSPKKREKILGVELRTNRSRPRQVFRFKQDEPINSEKVIVRDLYDQLLLNTGCAFLIQDAIA